MGRSQQLSLQFHVAGRRHAGVKRGRAAQLKTEYVCLCFRRRNQTKHDTLCEQAVAGLSSTALLSSAHKGRLTAKSSAQQNQPDRCESHWQRRAARKTCFEEKLHNLHNRTALSQRADFYVYMNVCWDSPPPAPPTPPPQQILKLCTKTRFYVIKLIKEDH